MTWCRNYVDDMLRKGAGEMHNTDPYTDPSIMPTTVSADLRHTAFMAQ